MRKERICGGNGYEIPCVHTLTGDERTVAIVLHGFGSSKESPTAAMLARELPARGVGALAFDFPAHGESPVDGTMLTIENCLNDLKAAEERARAISPEARIVYFASSFGAYINLIYLAERPHAGKRAFLRSAAVELPKLFETRTREEEEELDRQGYCILDRDYVHPLKITRRFLEDLASNDVFQIYRRGEAELFMVHGDSDETASPEAARRFAERFGAELVMAPGGDHRLSVPGWPERVLELAAEFFCRT